MRSIQAENRRRDAFSARNNFSCRNLAIPPRCVIYRRGGAFRAVFETSDVTVSNPSFSELHTLSIKRRAKGSAAPMEAIWRRWALNCKNSASSSNGFPAITYRFNTGIHGGRHSLNSPPRTTSQSSARRILLTPVARWRRTSWGNVRPYVFRGRSIPAASPPRSTGERPCAPDRSRFRARGRRRVPVRLSQMPPNVAPPLVTLSPLSVLPELPLLLPLLPELPPPLLPIS